MSDFLDVLAADALETVSEGYYETISTVESIPVSLRNAILQAPAAAVIAEIKSASPSKGIIRQNFEPEKVALSMMKGGAVGISVLTEPKHFGGSIKRITRIRRSVALPVLMKDVVVSPTQMNAASRIGANAVLLIQAIFDRGYCVWNVNEMIAKAHSNNIEVLLEVHNQDEFLRSIETNADLIGINNRNLGTLQVDLNTTKNLLTTCICRNKIVVSESGINTVEDVRFLQECGAQAFLVGSACMLADDVEFKVRELVNS